MFVISPTPTPTVRNKFIRRILKDVNYFVNLLRTMSLRSRLARRKPVAPTSTGSHVLHSLWLPLTAFLDGLDCACLYVTDKEMAHLTAEKRRSGAVYMRIIEDMYLLANPQHDTTAFDTLVETQIHHQDLPLACIAWAGILTTERLRAIMATASVSRRRNIRNLVATRRLSPDGATSAFRWPRRLSPDGATSAFRWPRCLYANAGIKHSNGRQCAADCAVKTARNTATSSSGSGGGGGNNGGGSNDVVNRAPQCRMMSRDHILVADPDLVSSRPLHPMLSSDMDRARQRQHLCQSLATENYDRIWRWPSLDPNITRAHDGRAMHIRFLQHKFWLMAFLCRVLDEPPDSSGWRIELGIAGDPSSVDLILRTCMRFHNKVNLDHHSTMFMHQHCLNEDATGFQPRLRCNMGELGIESIPKLHVAFSLISNIASGYELHVQQKHKPSAVIMEVKSCKTHPVFVARDFPDRYVACPAIALGTFACPALHIPKQELVHNRTGISIERKRCLAVFRFKGVDDAKTTVEPGWCAQADGQRAAVQRRLREVHVYADRLHHMFGHPWRDWRFFA